MAAPTDPAPELSVIIPVLQEKDGVVDVVEHVLGLSVPHPWAQRSRQPVEVVVVDGSATGDTIKALGHKEPVCMLSPPGRALQMNAGAGRARGDALLFLHADTRLPKRALHHIRTTLENPRFVGGAFELAFPQDATPGQRFIARAANWRNERTRAPYGDQGLFFKRAYFHRIGGFRPMPLMEDLELMTRIRKRGDAIRIIPDPVMTSARRWQREGTALCTARNLCLRGLYHLGMPPSALVRFYRFGKPGGGA